MSTVKVQGSATGTANFTVTVPSGTSTDRTFTLPDSTGTLQVSGGAISGSTGMFTGLVDISAASAGQIQFPATQNASSNANTLDDYEEGTWTPVIQGSTTAGTYTLLSFNGNYIKVGRQVSIIGRINATNFTGTGDFVIAGLPFPTAWECPVTVQFNANPWANLLSSSSQIVGIAGNGSSTNIIFRACGTDTTNGVYRQLTCGSSSVSYLRFAFTYFT